MQDEREEFVRHLGLGRLEGNARRFLRPDFKRFVRPDAMRYLRPDRERYLGPDLQERKKAATKFSSPANSGGLGWRPEAENLEFRREIAALRTELALLRVGETWRKALHHSNFQARVPEGNPDGGQFTDGGGGAGSRIRLAGPLPPGIGHNQGPPLNDPPEIPKTEPSTRSAKNDFYKAAATWLTRARAAGVGVAGFVAAYQALSWLDTDRVFIETYQDPPKTLPELQQAALTRQKGYHVHHNVEKDAAEDAGFPASLYNGTDKLVRVPALKHWEITGWFCAGTRALPLTVFHRENI